MNKELKWINRYMGLAKHVASWSEDNKKQVGSVLTRDNRVISLGYNGLPTGVETKPERFEKDIKLNYFEHAERNCIFTAAKMGHSTMNCTLYSTFFPCPDCARAIIQSGIVHLITMEMDPQSSWFNKMKISEEMLQEAGIKITYLKEEQDA
jgi:dCMP deaminase